jgi:N-acetylmuramoyl-L-alanine amidase
MNRISLCFGALLFMATGIAAAAQTRISGLHLWTAPGHARLTFDAEGVIRHHIRTQHGPERVVIDLHNARLTVTIPATPDGARLLRDIRSHSGHDLQVTVDLSQPVRVHSHLAAHGHQLVVDLQEIARSTSTQMPSGRAVVVVIDPGHGGDDPGAEGMHGTQEKTVVLGIARRLAARINGVAGMRAVLTRSDDRYIDLRQRMNKARAARADLFISIHADASSDNPDACGGSVFVLSDGGASSEAARWLAEKENAADRVGRVTLDGKDNLLASVLLNMSQSATMESSRHAAESVLQQLHNIGQLHQTEVQHAGFAVLKAPDIPGLLVETAYISNAHEEANLRSARQQERLAGALFTGIRHYFYAYPPVGSRLTEEARQHSTRRRS